MATSIGSRKSVLPSYKGLAPASAAATKVGRSNRCTNTAPEHALRRTVHQLGGRYRLHSSVVPGRPDLVFPGARVAVFCDGDFWHGRNWEQRRSKLARGANAAYWVAKIQRNGARDAEVNTELRAAGWVPLRFWENELKRDPIAAAKKILRVVRRRQPVPRR